VSRVVVRWPTGVQEAFAVSGVDRLVTLTEGRGTPVAPSAR
jgi:enediyne biosynthesis protein E4